MRYALLGLVLILAACTSPVRMQHPETGAIVECGPYPAGGLAGISSASREAQCINDYKEQGFVRFGG